jgi:hypothetical protein
MGQADTQFQARRMVRNDVPIGQGQCDIRLRVDGEVEVSVVQDRVNVRTITGRDARDEGSECNEPLPARILSGFNFQKVDGRGEMVLLRPPDRQSGFRSVVRIRDGSGGDARYHFRLSWTLDGGGYNTTRDGRYPDGRYGDGTVRGTDPYGRARDNRQGIGNGRAFSVDEAVSLCTQSVRTAIDRDYRYANAEIVNAHIDDRPGRNDVVIGDAVGRRGRTSDRFTFSCSVNFANGNVRNVDVRPASYNGQGQRIGMGNGNGRAFGVNEAVNLCTQSVRTAIDRDYKYANA